jgi:hypothetical protein
MGKLATAGAGSLGLAPRSRFASGFRFYRWRVRIPLGNLSASFLSLICQRRRQPGKESAIVESSRQQDGHKQQLLPLHRFGGSAFLGLTNKKSVPARLRLSECEGETEATSLDIAGQ